MYPVLVLGSVRQSCMIGDGNTLFKTSLVQKTQGANSDPFNHPGTAESQTSQSFPFSLNLLAKTEHAAVIAMAHDSSGFPNSLAQFTKTVNEVGDF